ncbi:MAG: FhaA domain-containing protein [Acidimicrobiia bacterium]
MGLKGFERRLERLVEGTFSKAFRSGVEPVEIGRKIVRAVDAGRRLGVAGNPVVPNDIVVYLSPTDLDAFQSYADALCRDLADATRTHAKEEGYRFLGPVSVALASDDDLRTGDVDVVAAIAEGAGGRVGSLVLPDGGRVALGDEPAVIGRLPECAVTLNDPRTSRHHAEVRPYGDGFVLVDLGSMNGTTLNGVAVRQQELADGDVIGVGSTTLRFEAS